MTKKGCKKEIDFITGQHIIMHREICGKVSNYGDYKGKLILCNECQNKNNKIGEEVK